MSYYKDTKSERDSLLKQQITEEVKSFYQQFGSVRREEFCKANKRSSSTVRRLFGSWNDMLRECNVPVNMQKKVTKEDVKKEMLALYEKHGKLTAEIQRAESSYSQIVIDNLFGSFGAMMDQIGLREEKAYQKYTDEELLESLRHLYSGFGYLDSKLIEQGAKATYQTYVARFGTCAQAVQKAGLIYGHPGHGNASREAKQIIDIMAEILEERPHVEFAFDWLRNDRGGVLPVDAYFEKANLVVEYNGVYHYHHTPFMHQKKSLQEVQTTDKKKRTAVLNKGIQHIEFAYNEPKTFDYIFRRLKKEIGFKVVTI